MPYPTTAEIDAAVPVAGTPSRAKTNALLRALTEALPSGTPRQVVAFDPTTGVMEAATFTADMWSGFPGEAPTEGVWVACYIPGSQEVLGFGEASAFPLGNSVALRTAENGPFTGGRLKCATAMDPEDAVNMALFDARAMRLGSGVPESPDSAGFAGQYATDSDYLYVCVSSGQWRRTPMATW